MLLVVLLVPALMITFGCIFLYRAPERMNYFFGYRTRRSMKSLDAWNFAHAQIARWWLALGSVFCAFDVGVMAFIFDESKTTVSIVGCVLSAISIVVLIIPIFPTESALKKHFDKDGNRISDTDEK